MHDRKWQFKVMTVKVGAFKSQEKNDELIQEKLNRMALEGWELVTVAHPYGGYPRLYFKR